MLDYDELNNLLTGTDAGTCAADCHGFLSAQACIGTNPEREAWVDYLDLRSTDDGRVADCHAEIDALLSETRRQLETPDFSFQPLLPDDETPLEVRVEALSEWCHGFLNGVAMVEEQAGLMSDGDARELIENFTRICQLTTGEEPDDEDERALQELIEYVRMGAVYIHDCLNPPATSVTEGPVVYH